MPSGPVTKDIRQAIRWVDGHADVWRLFADGALFSRCVKALVEPYRHDDVTHVAGIEARGSYSAAPRQPLSALASWRSARAPAIFPAQ